MMQKWEKKQQTHKKFTLSFDGGNSQSFQADGKGVNGQKDQKKQYSGREN